MSSKRKNAVTSSGGCGVRTFVGLAQLPFGWCLLAIVAVLGICVLVAHIESKQTHDDVGVICQIHTNNIIYGSSSSNNNNNNTTTTGDKVFPDQQQEQKEKPAENNNNNNNNKLYTCQPLTKKERKGGRLNSSSNNNNNNNDTNAATDYYYDSNDFMELGALEYTIDLPISLVNQSEAKLASGEEFIVSIPGATLTKGAVVVPDPGAMKVLQVYTNSSSNTNTNTSSSNNNNNNNRFHPRRNHRPQRKRRRRQLLRGPPSHGTIQALVIRAVALDGGPTLSSSQLSQLYFGRQQQQQQQQQQQASSFDLSIAEQFRKCSGGNFNIQPTKYGVLEVDVNVVAKGSTSHDLLNAVSDRSIELVEEDVANIRDLADLVVFVLPPGTAGNWGAYATMRGVQSVFNDRWAGYFDVMMHELGHNLGLYHANMGGREYKDLSGFMGRINGRFDGTAPIVGEPGGVQLKKCYNGQNNWYLQWYKDRAYEVDIVKSRTSVTGPTKLIIRPFVDYDETVDGEFVIVKVGDLYLQYNRAKKFNQDTGFMGDKLTVVRETHKGTNLVTGLDLQTPAYHGNIMVKGLGIVGITIQVCDVHRDGTELMVVSVSEGSGTACGTRPPASVSFGENIAVDRNEAQIQKSRIPVISAANDVVSSAPTLRRVASTASPSTPITQSSLYLPVSARPSTRHSVPDRETPGVQTFLDRDDVSGVISFNKSRSTSSDLLYILIPVVIFIIIAAGVILALLLLRKGLVTNDVNKIVNTCSPSTQQEDDDTSNASFSHESSRNDGWAFNLVSFNNLFRYS